MLKEKDIVNVNNALVQPDKVKVVIGPGTGFGCAYLTKSKFAPYHEVYPAEAGCTEWLPKTEQEKRLHLFIKEEAKISRIGFGMLCRGDSL